MKKSTILKMLLPLLLFIAATGAEAQIVNLSGMHTGTLAVYCPTDQVKLSAASTGSTTFVWKRYPGTDLTGTATTLAGTTANLVDATATTPGYYTYVSTGANTNCESVVSDPVTVYVLPGITAAVTGPATACVSAVGATVLTATAANATTVPETFGYTYQWYKGATAITGATGATYTLSSTNDATVGAQPYTVKVNYQIKPTCAEVAATPFTVTIQANPTKPVITITP